MRIAINAASIVPGFSTGIENFVYRLLGSLVSLSADDYTVIIPYGTKTDWISKVPPSLNLRYLELPPSASVVQIATRFRHIPIWRKVYDFTRSVQSLRKVAVAFEIAVIAKSPATVGQNIGVSVGASAGRRSRR